MWVRYEDFIIFFPWAIFPCMRIHEIRWSNKCILHAIIRPYAKSKKFTLNIYLHKDTFHLSPPPPPHTQKKLLIGKRYSLSCVSGYWLISVHDQIAEIENNWYQIIIQCLLLWSQKVHPKLPIEKHNFPLITSLSSCLLPQKLSGD